MKKYKLSEVSKIVGGGTPSTKNKEFYSGGIPWITPKDLSNHFEVRINNGARSITHEGLKNSSATLLPKNSILFSSRAPIGYVAISSTELCTNQGFKTIVPDENLMCYKYCYYKMLKEVEKIISSATGTTFKEVSGKFMKNYEIDLPPLSKQKEIADILSSFDDKIENNNKIIDTLEEISSVLYNRWFVDFEFPDENGLPYKSSGGKMVPSELGMIPDGWEVKCLLEYSDVVTGKLNANAATKDGKYKFFTCSQKDFSIDTYNFDGDAIIIAGNGDFSVKYYSGKFDAYQRTYVLIPKNRLDRDILFVNIKKELNSITSSSRGSVIKFITKGMLENHKVIECNNNSIKEMFKTYNDKITILKSENSTLEKFRDILIEELIK